MKVVFLVIVAVFCYDTAASDSSKEPDENSLITNVFPSNLDGRPELPSLHVWREEHGELVETEAEEIIPAEDVNNLGRTIGNGLSSQSIALNGATQKDRSMVKTDVTVNSRTSGEDKVDGNEGLNGLIVEDEAATTTTHRSTTRSRYTYRHKYNPRKQNRNLVRRINEAASKRDEAASKRNEAATKHIEATTRTYHRHVYTRNPLSLRNRFVFTTTAAPKRVIEEISENSDGSSGETSTGDYGRFRRNRFRMKSPSVIRNSAAINTHSNIDSDDSNNDANSDEVKATTSIYDKYRRNRPRMKQISMINTDEIITKAPEEEKVVEEHENRSDSEGEEPSSTTIYEKFRRNRHRMNWRPQTRKNTKLDHAVNEEIERSGSVENINENENPTELPATTSIYEKYRRSRPRMLPIPKFNTKEIHTEVQAETKIDDLEVDTNLEQNNQNEDNLNTHVGDETLSSRTIYNKFRRNRHRMQWRPQAKKIDLTNDEKEDKLSPENIVENENPTELPVSTSIYEKYRRSRPRMRPISRLNIEANIHEKQVERKTDSQLMQTHPNVQQNDQNGSLHANIEDETSSSTTIYEKFRRNRPRVQWRPQNNDEALKENEEIGTFEVNELPLTTSIYENFRKNRLRKLPALPLTIRSRNFDEDIDDTKNEDDKTDEPTKDLAAKPNSHTFGVDVNQDLPDMISRSKDVLKRKSRENNSFKTTVQELDDEPSEDLFSVVEDHDESLFETHGPAEETSFFDVETTTIPSQIPSEKVTVSLPTSFNIEDKTEPNIPTNPDAEETSNVSIETSTNPLQDPIEKITATSFKIEDETETNMFSNPDAKKTYTFSLETSTILPQDPIEKITVSPTSLNIEDKTEFTNPEETTTLEMETTTIPSQETSEKLATFLPTNFSIDDKTETKEITNPAESDLETTTPELVTIDPKNWFGISYPEESIVDENDKTQTNETTSEVSEEQNSTVEAQVTELKEVVTEESTDIIKTTVSIESLEQNDVPKIHETTKDDIIKDVLTPEQTTIIYNTSSEIIEIATITNDLSSSSIVTDVSTETTKISSSSSLPITIQNTTTENTVITTEIDNTNIIIIDEQSDDTLDNINDDVVDTLDDNLTDTKEHEDLTSLLLLDDNYDDEEDYKETHHIFKIPPVHETHTKKPVISGSIFGTKTNLTIELIIKNITIEVPANVTVQEDPLNPKLSFTWSASRDTNYTMSLNLSKGAFNYYEINGVEIYAAKDGNVSVWKKNDSIRGDEENEENALIVDVEDDVKILFSDRKFLKMMVENRNEDVASEAAEATEQLKTYYLEIGLGVLALVFFLAFVMYIVIRKLKKRYIREQNKLPTECHF